MAHLTLDLIERQLDISKEKVIDITSHLPQNVNEAYERILCRTFSKEKATRMLHLIIAADRPLTVGEMIVALELQQHHQSIDDIEIEPEGRFREKIRDICGLVTVSESRIFLLHQTVKEFLISINHAEPASLSWKHSVLVQDPNLTLTYVCVWCLQLDHSTKGRQSTNSRALTHTSRNSFFNYAAKHWANHFNRLSVSNQKKMTNLALEICDDRGPCFLAWSQVYWLSRHGQFVSGFTTLMAASYFGLEPVLRRIIKTQYSQLNRKDETYHKSALSWAAGNGHDGVVEQLIRGLSIGPRSLKMVLRRGANVNELDSENRTPLTYAIWNGHLSVVHRLVEAGAWVDVPDVLGGTPTSYAVTSGNSGIKALLVRGNVPRDPNHKEGGKLLLSAAKYGHINVVRVLVEAKETNINLKDGEGWTPLMWAINYRHNRIIKLLLEHKAEVNIRDRAGMTPLHFATRYGQFEVAKLILQTGRADVNMPDLTGLTPLHQTARWKQDDIAQLILRTGVANIAARVHGKDPAYSWVIRYNSCSTLKLMFDLYDDNVSVQDCAMAIFESDNECLDQEWADKLKVLLKSRKIDISMCDDKGENILHRAVTKRSYEMIKEILATEKAPTNSRNSRGLTPLALACLTLDSDAVSPLLEADSVDLNIADNNGYTPLHHAVQEHSAPITSALIATGKASVDMKNRDGRTPLSLACLSGNTTLAKYFLHSPLVNINAQDKYGRTPAHNCVLMGDVNMLRLILRTGRANLNVVDNLWHTPILLAAYRCQWQIVFLLLKYKQAINMKDRKGRTVLFWAIIHRQADVVRLLISLEQTDLNVRDEEGLTPLSHAAQQGNEEIIRILFDDPYIEVEVEDNTGMTALGHAAKGGAFGGCRIAFERGQRKAINKG
ncbi:ankyrin repeat domain protein [Fusarium subglutinans]|uniref:Ankyrin repeat domain protein n=1 Tax=Gibberella subglutinans TaxID=42677 RepID=A0A8H5V7P5_GIBSU|nr:ankyrin repeat domain protein [Fusarium subglutinans]KAF5613591.1 ankyrin repeat domain protein [Fusarium subglutinans]